MSQSNLDEIVDIESNRRLINGFALFSAICGFLGYGGWAVAANWDYGMEIAFRAGVVQGSYSFMSTLGFSLVMDKLFSMGHTPFSSFCYAAFGATFIMYGFTLSIHWINETPELFLTVLPGVVVGSVYSFIYSLNLLRTSNGVV